MKEIILTEEQLKNLQGIGSALFEDETDPRSNAYIRQLTRPKISWLKIAAFTLLPIVLMCVIGVGISHLGAPTLAAVLVPICLLVIYVTCFLKRAIICCVRIYQRYAPASIREKCRFEPSCSEYMILSIEKHGLFKGVSKGINRLRRCNVNDGGFDMP